ncbi:hypothetical protein GH733_009282, partial [Mirounga leonina]
MAVKEMLHNMVTSHQHMVGQEAEAEFGAYTFPGWQMRKPQSECLPDSGCHNQKIAGLRFEPSRHSQKSSGHFCTSIMDGRTELLRFPDQEEQANVHHQPSYLKAHNFFCSGLVHPKTVGGELAEDHKSAMSGQQACRLLCMAINKNTEATLSSIGHMICKNKYHGIYTWPHRQTQCHPAWPEAYNGEKE